MSRPGGGFASFKAFAASGANPRLEPRYAVSAADVDVVDHGAWRRREHEDRDIGDVLRAHEFRRVDFRPRLLAESGVDRTRADGSQENLPDLGELNDPAVQARYPDIPTYMGDNPGYMGLGIKREEPSHF